MDLHKTARDPWVWGQVALIVLVAVVAPVMPRYLNLGNLDFALNGVGPRWLRVVGGLLALGGVALSAWGMKSLGPSLTPGTEPLPGAPLVTSGAYAHVRHPIYTGVVLILAGYTLAWSNWTLTLLVGLVARQFFDAKARTEERWLVERYPEYERYGFRVGRRGV
jgi:protein-S-isoprenylcysteine O-methyltransferase Ste14